MNPICSDRSLWKFDLLEPFCKNITNFVTSRHGGYSEGNYATFNPSPYSGDDVPTVEKNLEKLRYSLPQNPKGLFRPRQVHGVNIRIIDRDFLELPKAVQEEQLRGVDALCTDVAGYAVCVSTADCVPILLYDKRHQAVAAVHSGWRGTVQQILFRSLEQMNKTYGTNGNDVYACIGPSISVDAFEIGEEVYDAFKKAGFPMQLISIRNESTLKHHIDLWKANTIQLESFGVPSSQIEVSGICTYTNNEDFFSARRLGINSGRILSGIMINQSVSCSK